MLGRVKPEEAPAAEAPAAPVPEAAPVAEAFAPATFESVAIETPAAESFEQQPVASEPPQVIPFEQPREETDRTPHLASLEEQLRNLLGTAVEIKLKSKDAGTILIPFTSNEEFERILRSLHRAAA